MHIELSSRVMENPKCVQYMFGLLFYYDTATTTTKQHNSVCYLGQPNNDVFNFVDFIFAEWFPIISNFNLDFFFYRIMLGVACN